MLHVPKCDKCGHNTRLVAYRYNDGAPTWTCASCAGCGYDTYRNYVPKSEVEAFLEPTRLPVQRREHPEPKSLERRQYTGYRARHDPLGY